MCKRSESNRPLMKNDSVVIEAVATIWLMIILTLNGTQLRTKVVIDFRCNLRERLL